MDGEVVTVPLENLNCKHCSLFMTDNCHGFGFRSIENPNKHYCYHIFRNYLGNKEEENMGWLENLEE